MSVVGNHTTLFGPSWLRSILEDSGCQFPAYGCNNLTTAPVECSPPELMFDSFWLTTEDTVKDLSGDTRLRNSVLSYEVDYNRAAKQDRL